MSDQNNKVGDGVHEDHYCEHPGCKAWGGFGFSRSKAEKSSWHCWEHYPQRDMFKSGLSADRQSV
ncbi:hypothetical protein DXT96_06480 [Agrobacterium sp. ICMP 6402]|nr:hypothetical protein [Agrobacterium sp. ICMP 6402]MQB09502.1 hypothetical protein [Agrobacterium sp. ICMP 6402]